jgi:hypothetical protein
LVSSIDYCGHVVICSAGGIGDLCRDNLENGRIDTVLSLPISGISFLADQAIIGLFGYQSVQSVNLLTQQFIDIVSPMENGMLAITLDWSSSLTCRQVTILN